MFGHRNPNVSASFDDLGFATKRRQVFSEEQSEMWNYVSSTMTLNAISADDPLARHSKRNGQSRNTELSGSILVPSLLRWAPPIITDSPGNAKLHPPFDAPQGQKQQRG
jgi:hypothetical protein